MEIRLSGVVVDDKGVPVAGATVTYSSVPARITSADGRRISTGPFVGSAVRTGADGRFIVTGLPPAPYDLCAYGTKENHLGSCEWVQGTTRVVLASGQASELRLQVAEGTMLTFQVQDPKHQIRDLADIQMTDGRLPLTGANFAIGIWVGARYVRARLVSTSGATRRYQLPISKTAVARLFVETSLNVVDTAGMAVLTKRQSTTITAGGLAEVVLTMTIP